MIGSVTFHPISRKSPWRDAIFLLTERQYQYRRPMPWDCWEISGFLRYLSSYLTSYMGFLRRRLFYVLKIRWFQKWHRRWFKRKKPSYAEWLFGRGYKQMLAYKSACFTRAKLSRILICCGQTASHFPHWMHWSACFLPWPPTNQFSWWAAAALSP